MTTWTAGYLADIGYTFGYYAELNPLRQKLAFLQCGLVPPEIGTHCELGFGQGVSVNIHAAGSGCTWYGTDFNPAQTAFARSLAAASGAPAHLYEDSFADFCARSDLPEFDSIALHGIWSWIDDENRTIIVDFIRRKLKAGGVLYVSYNTQPGWAAMAPMRELLAHHADSMIAKGAGILNRVDAALAFADRLMAADPAYARANPKVAKRLEEIKTQPRNYVAHEYFNRNWMPMSFSAMQRWLAPAKLDYACSAHYIDHVDALNLSADQQSLLKDIPDPLFRETVRDFCVNQQFRRDYWVKGARRLTTFDQRKGLQEQRVMLVKPRADFAMKATGSLGEATLQRAVYDPILDVLADHRPRSLGEIADAVPAAINFTQVVQAAMILGGTANVLPVQDDASVARAKPSCDRLNAYLMKKSRSSEDVTFLASPVTGSGIGYGRIHQLFLLALREGGKQPAELAQSVWGVLAAQGQKVVKEGKELETPDENLAELTALADSFLEKRLPILQALQVA